jgi:hypothetical protein
MIYVQPEQARGVRDWFVLTHSAALPTDRWFSSRTASSHGTSGSTFRRYSAPRGSSLHGKGTGNSVRRSYSHAYDTDSAALRRGDNGKPGESQ